MNLRSLALLTVFTAACGGGGKNDADPRVIPGGGIGDGAVDGVLNVYAIDGDTDDPVAGATVMVGEPGAEPLTGVTDSSGLYRFEDDSLSDGQTITVVADGYAVSTWYGANGANVTIPLTPEVAAAVPQARLSGTIEGWADLTPASNHVYIAFVSYSQSSRLGDPGNDLAPPQGMNVCLNAGVTPSCNWAINARAGQVAVYALIFDNDTKGTLADTSDDTRELVGMAYQLGVTVQDGVAQTGMSLTQADAGTMEQASLSLQTEPSGLTETIGAIQVDLGADGLLLFANFDDPAGSFLVPKRQGDFASATMRAVAITNDGAANGASSIILKRGITDVSSPIDMGAWLGLPSGLTLSAGTYSFTPVADTAVHTVDLEDNGDTLWNIGLFDGRTSFVLPAVSPSPITSGSALDFHVSAIDGDVDLQDFSIDDLQDVLDRLSGNVQAVTP